MIPTSVNYTAQSVALHQFVVGVMKLKPPESVPLIMLSTACLEPFAGFLYVLSSIPAIREEGFWFMKREKNGMIRPNTRTLIPMFVLVYIGLSMATIHCFLKDWRKSILSTVTVTLSLTTYPFMLCMGKTSCVILLRVNEDISLTRHVGVLLCLRRKPTIVWNVLTLMPRHKAGLAMRQTNGDSTLTYFQPRTLNILSAFFYSSPFVFGGPLIYLLTLDVMDINHRFRDYSYTFTTIMTGDLEPQTVLKLNIEAITQLVSMRQRGDKVLFFARLISFGYFLSTLVLLCLMLFGYYRILQAVRYQIRVFHQAVEPRVPLTSIISSGDNSGPKTMVDSTSGNTSCGDANILKWRRKAFKTVLRFPSWLPALRPDPDFLRKPCASSTSDNLNLNESQPWERNNRAIIYTQWNALKKYHVNLIWQACCIAIVMVILMGMDVVIFSNYLEVPTRHRLSDLNWFTVCVTNATWVWTMGIPFGLVSLNCLFPLSEHHPVLVAFSSPITALREKVDIVDEFDY
ncbi:hypothetical protein VP01_1578g4 [Puccinia sorghi]|uniref:Uncharacterized protein n=1 Tax=Puccinia sorghi TaxID=27349 RepID=A0A0L6VJI0_9BASI|nr:hypothetical protein VP01_1578g4 [Puccinia sorghi]